MFKAIIDQILDESLPLGELYKPVSNWGKLFQEITEKKEVRKLAENKKRTLLPHGLAIDPYSAGTCLNDIVRSTQYTRGLYTAIKDLHEIITDRPVHIVYAGSGPYAPFVMAMATQFSSNQVQFTIIDIHEESLDVVKSIAEELDFQDYFRKYVHADAVTYQVEDELPVDIGLAECLNKGLIKEPQVAISMNLVNQMEDHGIMIPEKISVDAYLVNPNVEFSFLTKKNGERVFDRAGAVKQRLYVGHLMNLSKPLIRNLIIITDANLNNNYNVQLGDFPVEVEDNGTNTMMYSTTVTTYGHHVIDEYQSGLTQPHIVNEKQAVRTSCTLHFVYKLCEAPGFDYTVN